MTQAAWDSEMRERMAEVEAASQAKDKELERMAARAATSRPSESAQTGPTGQPKKPRFKFHSDPDRRLTAKRAIAEAAREADERQSALDERRRQAKVEKLRVKDRLHSRAVRKLMRPIHGSKMGLPWPQLAVVCAGLAALTAAISLSNIPLPNITDSMKEVAAPAASP